MSVARTDRTAFTEGMRQNPTGGPVHTSRGASLLRTFMRVLLRVEITGDMPQEGPVLFVAPHRSLLDHVLLAWLLHPQPLLVVSREDLRGVWLRVLLRVTPHLVAEASDPATLRKVLRVVAAGRSVLMYPEGRLVDAPGVMKNYAVPALVAAKAHLPVVPVVARRRGRLGGWTLRVSSAARVQAPAGNGAGGRARRARAFPVSAP